MAIIYHISYNGISSEDCARTNEYITDGHGQDPSIRTNRYISDGHGGNTICEAHNCPTDPAAATEYMKTLRLNYERQHPQGESRTKGAVTHEHIVVSFHTDEAEMVSPDLRMVINRELIERTFLKNFASRSSPHDNEPERHYHMSICPYSLDGTHKLCLNNKHLNELRRELDYICYEHGLSIVENPELWGDKAYKEWFDHVKEEGKIVIRPPRDQDMSTYKKSRKRALTYAERKEVEAQKEAEIEQYYKDIYKGYGKIDRDIYYSTPHLFNPKNPKNPNTFLRIKRFKTDGTERSEIELMTASMGSWARDCAKELANRNIPGSAGLQKKMMTLSNSAYDANRFLESLDIHTMKELIGHMKECGQDISELKQDIRRQETIIERMADITDAIDRWENQKDAEAYAYLKSHRCGTSAEIADAKKRYSRAVARKAKNEDLLAERKKEYRLLKNAEAALHPASCKEEWNDYITAVLSKEAAKKVGYTSPERLSKRLHAMGEIAGLSSYQVDMLIERAKKTAAQTTWEEYQVQFKFFFIHDAKYYENRDKVSELYAEIRDLQEMKKKVPILGPFTLALFLAIGIFAGFRQFLKEIQLAELEAQMRRAEWRELWKRFREVILDPYCEEVRMESARAIETIKSEYRDLVDIIAEQMSKDNRDDGAAAGSKSQSNALDDLIGNADRKKVEPERKNRNWDGLEL